MRGDFIFELKFLVLKTLYNSPLREIHQSDLYNLDKVHPLEIRTAIKDLVESKLIERITGSEKYHLTSTGANLYEQSQQHNAQSAEVEKQHRFNRGIAIISLIISLITLVVSLVELSLQIFNFI